MLAISVLSRTPCDLLFLSLRSFLYTLMIFPLLGNFFSLCLYHIFCIPYCTYVTYPTTFDKIDNVLSLSFTLKIITVASWHIFSGLQYVPRLSLLNTITSSYFDMTHCVTMWSRYYTFLFSILVFCLVHLDDLFSIPCRSQLYTLVISPWIDYKYLLCTLVSPSFLSSTMSSWKLLRNPSASKLTFPVSPSISTWTDRSSIIHLKGAVVAHW